MSHRMRGLIAVTASVAVAVSGCAFQGVNTLPLPGAVGRGPDASVYHVHLENVATLEPNSPVLIDDVVVGSVGEMKVEDWYANVEVSVKPDIVVPENAVASVGQTSLLGSMHLQLSPPIGEAPRGRLAPGATSPINRSSTYPSTERTLASLSIVVNDGGLGQIGDVIGNLNEAFSGREPQLRALLTRLDTFVGTLDRQRTQIIDTITELNRLSATFADQNDTINETLEKLPPALDVLIRERPRLTEALTKLGTFADAATRLTNLSKDNLVTNLRHLEPTLRALADVGPGLNFALAYATVFPFGQQLIDRAVRGDYFNLFAMVDITVPRLKRTILLGTRWGQPNAPLVAAPGEPWYTRYTYDPVGLPPVIPPPPDGSKPAPPPPGVVSPMSAEAAATPYGDPLGMYPPASVMQPPPPAEPPTDGPR